MSGNQQQYPDEALDPHHQHLHAHKHHAPSAQKPLEVHADMDIQPRKSVETTREDHYRIDNTKKTDLEKDGMMMEETKNISSIERGEILSGSEDGTSHSQKPLTKAQAFEQRMSNGLQSCRSFYDKHRWFWHIFWSLFFFAWWVSIVARPEKRHHAKWLIPTVLTWMIIARFITFHVPARYIVVAANWIWQRTFVKAMSFIPEKFHMWLFALVTLAMVLIGTFCTPEYPGSQLKDRAVSFFGCVVVLFVFYITSHNRKAIRWHTIISGFFIQYILALFVMRTKAGKDFFNFIAFLAQELLGFANKGLAFLQADWAKQSFFVFTALPSIIFFVAFVHILYYWGVVQWGVEKFAVVFFWAMRVSGSDAVVAASSPFIGQGESALLIKPFINHLTDSEIHQVMTSGLSTISGSMFASYIAMGINPTAVITSAILSISASLLVSKLRYPETEESITANRVIVPDDEDEEKAHNILHAFSNGASLGLTIAGMIATNILCIISLVALINALLTWFAGFWNIENLTLEMIMGYLLYPVAFLLGAPRDELYKIAKIIGIKIIQNEFVAFSTLKTDPEYANLSIRGEMLTTFAVCGFANLGSVGTNIAVLGALAPKRAGTISKLAVSTLISGAVSTLLSAAVAGMVMADMAGFQAASKAAAAAHPQST